MNLFRPYEILANHYDAARDSWIEEWRFGIMELSLKKSNRRFLVLDIGCGTGVAAQSCSELTPWRFHGVDISSSMIEKIPDRTYERVYRRDFLAKWPSQLRYPIILAGGDLINYFTITKLNIFFGKVRKLIQFDGLLLIDFIQSNLIPNGGIYKIGSTKMRYRSFGKNIAINSVDLTGNYEIHRLYVHGIELIRQMAMRHGLRIILVRQNNSPDFGAGSIRSSILMRPYPRRDRKKLTNNWRKNTTVAGPARR